MDRSLCNVSELNGAGCDHGGQGTKQEGSSIIAKKRWLPDRVRIPVRARIVGVRTGLTVMRRRMRGDKCAQPDFIIIGAQKAGTSSIYAYLEPHPQVSPALSKEIHYFDLNYEKGPQWYSAHFPLQDELAQIHGITGEASPYYMVHPHAIGRILEDLPNVKLIALLRDPVERAISHYFHEKRHGTERLSLPDAILAEEKRLAPELEAMRRNPSYRSKPLRHFSYLYRSRYADQLKPLLPLLDEQRLLMLKSEDLFEDPQGTMSKTFAFLGLPDMEGPRRFGQLNRGKKTSIEPELRAMLVELLREPTRELKQLTGIGWPEKS